ncbi:hypothetical protein IWQ62_000083 [Dispira parvispora]|uniref:Uncharacterized protein n=1 Tax=Dispira parvispora TaxID=1520584 RepID=A0A9W8EAK1_9FUNG|nr:hypothetical protein IWQ62_000083 [Dispira parvispora]
MTDANPTLNTNDDDWLYSPQSTAGKGRDSNASVDTSTWLQLSDDDIPDATDTFDKLKDPLPTVHRVSPDTPIQTTPMPSNGEPATMIQRFLRVRARRMSGAFESTRAPSPFSLASASTSEASYGDGSEDSRSDSGTLGTTDPPTWSSLRPAVLPSVSDALRENDVLYGQYVNHWHQVSTSGQSNGASSPMASERVLRNQLRLKPSDVARWTKETGRARSASGHSPRAAAPVITSWDSPPMVAHRHQGQTLASRQRSVSTSTPPIQRNKAMASPTGLRTRRSPPQNAARGARLLTPPRSPSCAERLARPLTSNIPHSSPQSNRQMPRPVSSLAYRNQDVSPRPRSTTLSPGQGRALVPLRPRTSSYIPRPVSAMDKRPTDSLKSDTHR